MAAAPPAIRQVIIYGGIACLTSFCLFSIGRNYAAWVLIGLIVIMPGSAFMLAAVRQACRKCRHFSARLSPWHALWALIFLSGLVFRNRDVQTLKVAPIDLWAVYRIILVSLVAFTLMVHLALRRREWLPSLFRGIVGVMAAYALVCVVSTVWSVYPAWTLYKSLEYVVDIGLLAAILAHAPSEERYKTFIDLTWVLLALLLVTVWVGAVVWPDEAFVPAGELVRVRLAGVLPGLDQTDVGEFGAILAIVAVSRLITPARERTRAFYCVVVIFGVVTLLASQTRADLVGFIFALLLVLWFARRFRTLVLVIVLLGLILSMTDREVLTELWGRGDSPETMESLSDRVPAWQLGWNRFLDRPLTGYGAYAGGRFAVLPEVGATEKAAMLNTYMEVSVGTGIWGIIPILCALIGTWQILIHTIRISGTHLQRHLPLEALAVLALLTVRSFTSSQFVWHPSLHGLVILGYAEVLRRRRRCCEDPRGA